MKFDIEVKYKHYKPKKYMLFKVLRFIGVKDLPPINDIRHRKVESVKFTQTDK